MTGTYDVIIMGSGPAGLQASIHAARRKASALVIGKLRKSSIYSAHIDNFCCLGKDTGMDMLATARRNAEASGARFLDEDVVKLSPEAGGYFVQTETSQMFHTTALILAMGISRNNLNLKNEKSLLGRGVSYCVDCDGGFFRGEKVAVVGCESAAITGALTLLFYAGEVHLVCKKLDAADYLAEKLKESDIIVHEGRTVGEIVGEDSVKGLVLDDGAALDVSGIFIELGAKGATVLAGDLGVHLDAETMQYISVNKKQETNIPGVYAAGDICGPPWQVAKAIGEGCVAGLEAAAFAKKNRREH